MTSVDATLGVILALHFFCIMIIGDSASIFFPYYYYNDRIGGVLIIKDIDQSAYFQRLYWIYFQVFLMLQKGKMAKIYMKLI